LYAANDQHTVVTGAVDDVRPYLAYASLSCVPLDAGSGTKYKVLEALSAGVPVVCTPLAAEGLEVVHGEHVLIGQGDQELADAIIRLLEDSSLAEMMAQRGRRLIEKRYTWDANLAKLDRWLETIAELPPHRVENAGRL
jgi:glycosyltransferase involved in cell wall biosynthesis